MADKEPEPVWSDLRLFVTPRPWSGLPWRYTMSTVIRAKLSACNPYYIEKYRYLELKNFCLQYSFWKSRYEALDSLVSGSSENETHTQKEYQDPVGRCVESREFYYDRIIMLKRAAIETDPVIGDYILTGVTQGVSYDALNARATIPCCREIYYELYRKFFWILDKLRG